MIKKTLKTLKRAPVRAIAVLLFAAVISMIICALHASNEAELQNYEEMWQSVPVTVTVTDPTGTLPEPTVISTWVVDLFSGEEPVKFYDVSAANDYKEASQIKPKEPSAEISLAEYLKDIQIRMQQKINTVNGQVFGSHYLYGITSLTCDKRLLPEYGSTIIWDEGYDEGIFAGEELVCIIPEGMTEYYDNGGGEVVLNFHNSTTTVIMVDGVPQISRNEVNYPCTLKIVGTYTGGDELSVYCSVPIVKHINSQLSSRYYYDVICYVSATLSDNRRLEEFREKASYCFLEPSPNAEQVPWGFYANVEYNDYYKYALDINDDNLFDLSAILEDSIKFNRTVTVFVVILSVVAGFLVGFLMVRRRKRDIMLMRMVGESNARVYVGFVLEQMICIILGIAVGGAYYMWKPMDNLVIFAVTYFVALSLALVIFMSKKLIKNVKEDE